MRKLTIERDKWARGNKRKKVFNALLNDDGTMCCLGFYSLACGLQPDEVKDMLLPSQVRHDNWMPAEMSWLTKQANPHRDMEHTLAGVNDSRTLDEELRESILKTEFALHGVEVEFV